MKPDGMKFLLCFERYTHLQLPLDNEAVGTMPGEFPFWLGD